MKRPLFGHWTDNGQTWEPPRPIGLALGCLLLIGIPITMIAAALRMIGILAGL